MRRRRSFRGVLLATTTIISALAPGLLLEPEFSAPLPGWWGAGLVVFHQPDFDPERPLAPLFGTTPTTAASGGFFSARVTEAANALDRVDAWVSHPPT